MTTATTNTTITIIIIIITIIFHARLFHKLSDKDNHISPNIP